LFTRGGGANLHCRWGGGTPLGVRSFYSTASEATGCNTQFYAVILMIALLSVASRRFSSGTVMVLSYFCAKPPDFAPWKGPIQARNYQISVQTIHSDLKLIPDLRPPAPLLVAPVPDFHVLDATTRNGEHNYCNEHHAGDRDPGRGGFGYDRKWTFRYGDGR